MVKYWPVVLLVALIGAVLYMSRYAENCKAEHQEHAQGSSPNAVISPNSNGQGAQNTNEAHQCPSWIDTFAWPEGVTAWSLLLTLLVIAWQSTETREAAQTTRDSVSQMQRQADLTERQIELLESEQWFKIDNWEVQPPDCPPGWLTISFDITNPGDRPFLMEGEAKLALTPQGPGVTYEITPIPLIPQKPERRVIVQRMSPDVCARYEESQHTALIIYFTVHGIRRYGDQKRKFLTIPATFVCRKGTAVTVEQTVQLYPSDAQSKNENGQSAQTGDPQANPEAGGWFRRAIRRFTQRSK